jgi:hypothetical protein
MDAAQADAVYQLMVKGFAHLGATDPRCTSRSFLLRDSCYAGQVWQYSAIARCWQLPRSIRAVLQRLVQLAV